jgi:hypothetical protein
MVALIAVGGAQRAVLSRPGGRLKLGFLNAPDL